MHTCIMQNLFTHHIHTALAHQVRTTLHLVIIHHLSPNPTPPGLRRGGRGHSSSFCLGTSVILSLTLLPWYDMTHQQSGFHSNSIQCKFGSHKAHLLFGDQGLKQPTVWQSEASLGARHSRAVALLGVNIRVFACE